MAALTNATPASTLESLRYSRGEFSVLDQLLIPHTTAYVPVANADDAWAVIRSMQVRGAPLIAIVAALGLATEVTVTPPTGSAEEARDHLLARMQHLRTSRPTAVNLFRATDALAEVVQGACAAPGATAAGVAAEFVAAAESMLEADVRANRAIGDFGAAAIIDAVAAAQGAAAAAAPPKVRVMTICNTGSLATAGYGTALGVVRALAERQALGHVFACETRPYNQGARLTAFEIVAESMPGTLICDSMASAAMRLKGVNAVVVGADRVACNGDSANKIGTYQLAIAAKHHGIPFFVAAPTTTVDPHMPTGEGIVIEERPAQELRVVAGTQVAPEGIAVWNPAFDVTPCSLITGIVTEHGVAAPDLDTGAFDMSRFLAEHGAA